MPPWVARHRQGPSRLHIRTSHLGQVVELFERGIAAVRRHVINAAIDSGAGDALDLLGARLRVAGDRDGLAPRVFSQSLQLRNTLDDLATVRHPAVGVADDALE